MLWRLRMTVPIPSSSELLQEYTRDIQLLLDPLKTALERRCIVVAQGAWHSIEGVALLPFHLHCIRNAPCSTLTLLSPRCGPDSNSAMHRIVAADIAILNLQAVRGDRTVALISAALNARGAQRPTLVIASSPADVLLLRDVQLL